MLIIGFVNAVSGLEVNTIWRHFYQISFFFGYIVSASLFYLFNRLSPPPGLGVQVDFDLDGTPIVESVEPEKLDVMVRVKRHNPIKA